MLVLGALVVEVTEAEMDLTVLLELLTLAAGAEVTDLTLVEIYREVPVELLAALAS
jgi:hypothetical protein